MTKNKLFVYFYTAVLVFALYGCNEQKAHTTKVLNEMIGSKVDLCYKQMECKQQPISSRCNKFKMIVYIDSTECTPCALSYLRYWNPIIRKTKKLDVCYIFIIAPKKQEIYDINIEMEVSDLENSVYTDNEYVFLKRNKNIPLEKNTIHSF